MKVQGKMIWTARRNQDLSLRAVEQLTGVSTGFQSEVENGRKTDVGEDLLEPWVRALQVTEDFARGKIQRLYNNPRSSRGLALDVGDVVRSRMHLPEWNISPAERLRCLTDLVVTESKDCPRGVLSYLFVVHPQVLDELRDGKRVPNADQIFTLSWITTLRLDFVRGVDLVSNGTSQALDQFLAAAAEAHNHGVTRERMQVELDRLIPPSSGGTDDGETPAG